MDSLSTSIKREISGWIQKQNLTICFQETYFRTCLMAQWLRICLTIQGTLVQSMIRELTPHAVEQVSQSYGFSSSHVWMWELDHKEGWVPNNWCFWTVMLEKSLESPLDCKEIQPVHPIGDLYWMFIGRTDVEAEAPILGHLMQITDLFEKSLMLGKIGGGRRRGREDEMVGWHHGLNGHEFE